MTLSRSWTGRQLLLIVWAARGGALREQQATKLSRSFDFPRQLIRSVTLKANSRARDITACTAHVTHVRGSGRASALECRCVARYGTEGWVVKRGYRRIERADSVIPPTGWSLKLATEAQDICIATRSCSAWISEADKCMHCWLSSVSADRSFTRVTCSVAVWCSIYACRAACTEQRDRNAA